MTHHLRSQLAAQHERGGHSWGHLAEDRWAAVTEYAGRSVLDMGCANGIYVEALARQGYSCLGADLLRYPQWSATPSRYMVVNAHHLPVPACSFDTIISFETLEHVPHPELALQEYHRVCRQNIILSVPNCEILPDLREANLAFYHWIDRTHLNFFTPETLTTLLSEQGFRVVEMKKIKPALAAFPMLRSLGLPRRIAFILSKLLLKIAVRKYLMSVLVVAEKQ